jgi:hypothetical protein
LLAAACVSIAGCAAGPPRFATTDPPAAPLEVARPSQTATPATLSDIASQPPPAATDAPPRRAQVYLGRGRARASGPSGCFA